MDSGTRGAVFLLGLGSLACALSGGSLGWVALSGWQFGNTAWEIAAVGELSAGFGLCFLGMSGLALIALMTGRTGWGVVAGSVLVALGVGLAVLALLAVLNAPIAWQFSRELPPIPARGYKLIAVKAAGLSIVYSLGCLIVAVRVLMASGPKGSATHA